MSRYKNGSLAHRRRSKLSRRSATVALNPNPSCSTLILTLCSCGSRALSSQTIDYNLFLAQLRNFSLSLREMAGGTVIVLLVMALVQSVQASDPELTTDFFAPEGTNKSTLTGAYFTSQILRNGTGLAAPAKYAIKRVNSEVFPALTGLGVSTALLEYRPGGINTLHTHPRGTEILTVAIGQLHVGLVDSSNKLYTQVLNAGDVFVFPKGLVHYQINLGTDTVIAYAAFSSSNPGTISLPGNIFASGIDDVVLQAAFKVDANVIDQLQAALQA